MSYLGSSDSPRLLKQVRAVAEPFWRQRLEAGHSSKRRGDHPCSCGHPAFWHDLYHDRDDGEWEVCWCFLSERARAHAEACDVCDCMRLLPEGESAQLPSRAALPYAEPLPELSEPCRDPAPTTVPTRRSRRRSPLQGRPKATFVPSSNLDERIDPVPPDNPPSQSPSPTSSQGTNREELDHTKDDVVGPLLLVLWAGSPLAAIAAGFAFGGWDVHGAISLTPLGFILVVGYFAFFAMFVHAAFSAIWNRLRRQSPNTAEARSPMPTTDVRR